MKYRKINGLGEHVSVLCMGAGPLHFKQEETGQIKLDVFVENGGNLFDTANIYGKWLESGKNESEIVLGNWLYDRTVKSGTRVRADFFISTKGGHPDLATMHIPRITETLLRQDLEESLAALRTDYIDIYWLHRDNPDLPVDCLIGPLLKFIREGKIRLFGLSNWKPGRIREVCSYLGPANIPNLFGVQNQWSLASINPEGSPDPTLEAMSADEYVWHCETGIPAMPYSGMARGYFTKRLTQTAEQLDPSLRVLYTNRLNERRFDALQALSKQTKRPVSQLSLAFFWHQPFPVFPINSYSDLTQINDSCAATEIVLTREEIDWLSQGTPY
jgi:aryl-alcohol dehydrogenase-like predicted oxidoreductase